MADNTWRRAQEAIAAAAVQRGIKQILLVDTETTGLDPETDRCIEIATARIDIESADVVESYASLIRAESNPAFVFNHIPTDLLKRAPTADTVWPLVEEQVRAVDLVISHRVEFDYWFIPKEIRKLRPWACSKFDIEWPKETKQGSDLLHLALAHGIAVVQAHRAASDVEVLTRLFTRTLFEMRLKDGDHDCYAYDWFARALRPKRRWQAIVSFENKDMAKDAGFAWDGDRKEWYKWVADEDAEGFPFKVRLSSWQK